MRHREGGIDRGGEAASGQSLLLRRGDAATSAYSKELNPDPYDPERDLAMLREAVEDMKAGRGRPFDEAMEEIALVHGFPWPPKE